MQVYSLYITSIHAINQETIFLVFTIQWWGYETFNSHEVGPIVIMIWERCVNTECRLIQDPRPAKDSQGPPEARQVSASVLSTVLNPQQPETYREMKPPNPASSFLLQWWIHSPEHHAGVSGVQATLGIQNPPCSPHLLLLCVCSQSREHLWPSTETLSLSL
jgi:hypothetical protein